jgi:hypothetical protein
MKYICHILKNNEKIKEINLEEILINDQECLYLKESLKNHEKIEKINLGVKKHIKNREFHNRKRNKRDL